MNILGFTISQHDVIIALTAVVLTFGINAGVSWLRRRGEQGVERARRALGQAKLTPDQRDDAIAELALEKALEDQKTLDWWAEQLANAKAGIPLIGSKLPSGAPVKAPGGKVTPVKFKVDPR